MNIDFQKIFKYLDTGVECFDVPLAPFTSFKLGGLADVFFQPETKAQLIELVGSAAQNNIGLNLLGSASNVIIADSGLRGLVLSTRRLNNFKFLDDSTLWAEAGAKISDLAWYTGSHGLAGLHHFYGMPGSIGGALFMNARCYGGEIADVLASVLVLDLAGKERSIVFEREQWSYKRSPFQTGAYIILEVCLNLEKVSDLALIKEQMRFNYADRKQKRHYSSLSAGSVFKNNHAWGRPSGLIIEELGLKGFSSPNKQAQIAPWHGNFIINHGWARSKDILYLIERIQKLARKRLSIELELELQLLGSSGTA